MASFLSWFGVVFLTPTLPEVGGYFKFQLNLGHPRSRFAGTLGDVGGYSLNYHKHIHTGEGGIVATDDDIADRVMLIRNHAEAVIGPKGQRELHNLLG